MARQFPCVPCQFTCVHGLKNFVNLNFESGRDKHDRPADVIVCLTLSIWAPVFHRGLYLQKFGASAGRQGEPLRRSSCVQSCNARCARSVCSGARAGESAACKGRDRMTATRLVVDVDMPRCRQDAGAPPTAGRGDPGRAGSSRLVAGQAIGRAGCQGATSAGGPRLEPALEPWREPAAPEGR